MGRRIPACTVQELSDGEMRIVPDAPFALAVCRVKQEWFAFENNCTHEDFPLTNGLVEDFEIECALHGARFCLRTGAIRALPASCPLRVFPVHLEDGVVLVEMP